MQTPSSNRVHWLSPVTGFREAGFIFCSPSTHPSSHHTFFLFRVPRPIFESTRVVHLHPYSYVKLALPVIPGYEPGDYYASIILPIKPGCATSATTGSTKLTIDGEVQDIKSIFMVSNPILSSRLHFHAIMWIYLRACTCYFVGHRLCHSLCRG